MAFFIVLRKCFFRYVKSCLIVALCGLLLLLGLTPGFAQTQQNRGEVSQGSGNLPDISINESLGLNTKLTSSGALTSATPSANPYGLAAIWLQGDWVAKGCLMLLAIMSIASWVVIITKTMALRLIRRQTKDALGVFGDVKHFASRISSLGIDNPLRFVAESGSSAAQHYAAVKPRVDYDTWLIRAIEQALSQLQTRIQEGMAVLATIGSTAPFVGLFGTVWAIYSALVKIGASGQASLDRVAGPVGEALIMTAIGLAVAVPAVFGYNWLLRQNKLALEMVRSFGARLHVLLLATSDGAEAVKPAPAVQVR